MVRTNSNPKQEDIDFAQKLHRKGRLEKAEKLYRKILKRTPDYADAKHYLGVLLHQSGKSKEAEKYIRGAIELQPDYLDAHINLGNVLKEQNLYAEAESTYRHAITLNPEHPETHNNLGVVLKAQGRYTEAVESYRKATELNPTYLDALKNLGNVLYSLGHAQEAVEVYHNWLNLEPGNPIAEHMLAAATGQSTPKRATDAYVEEIFNQYADKFDKSLKNLDYRAPKLVAEAVEQLFGEKQSNLIIFDAGCGTGLCAKYLRPYANSLIGVDLSTGMIKKAKKLSLYDELIVTELTEFLLKQSNHFDLIVSADTLCYFGALEEVTSAARLALRDNGYLIFTVEYSSERLDQGYKINTHGRYSHNESYVTETLNASGFKIKSISYETLRQELNAPVEGLLVVAQKE